MRADHSKNRRQLKDASLREQLPVSHRGRAGLGDFCVGGPADAAATAREIAQSHSLQFHGSPGVRDEDEVRRLAQEGVSGAGGRVPYLDQIQTAFRDFDLSGVRAFIGGAAAHAASAIGADAYALGPRLAFREEPDLRTTAHEVAHAWQQFAMPDVPRVGRAGDRFEVQADAIADGIVRGAPPVLSGGGSHAPAGAGVQRQEQHAPDSSARWHEAAESAPPKAWATSPVGKVEYDAEALGKLADAIYEKVPAGYRNKKGKQDLVKKMPRLVLLDAVDLDQRSPEAVAYLLATAQHEGQMGANMRELRNGITKTDDGKYTATVHAGSKETITADSHSEAEALYWDHAYGTKSPSGKRKGSTIEKGDGAKYRGRGLVQLTWEDNYRKMGKMLADEGFTYTHDGVTYGTAENPIDLVKHYDHVDAVPALASRLLVKGSVEGAYRGNKKKRYKLGDYFQEGADPDYFNARDVINGGKNHKSNGKKKGDIIADTAKMYAEVLKANGAWRKVFKPTAAQGSAEAEPAEERPAPDTAPPG